MRPRPEDRGAGNVREELSGNPTSVKTDPFVVGLLRRMPDEMGKTFTDQQLLALKVALGARQWRRHPVDLRGTLGLGRWRYYFVVVAGRERRQLSRREEHLARLGKFTLISGFLVFSVLLGLLVLYLIKSALGIDLIPGYSLGLWGWFKEVFM